MPGGRTRDETVRDLFFVDQTEAPQYEGQCRMVNGDVQIKDKDGIFNPREGTDEKARVSANDTTSGYLNGKLVAGTGITLTELDDGSDETLRIDSAGGSDELVGVSADDTDPGYLEEKIVAGSGIKLTTLNPGADEDLKVASGKVLAFSFAASVQSFVEVTSSSWAVMAAILFPGSTHMQASVASAKLLAWSSGGAGKPVDFRIYDVTNDLVIATLTGDGDDVATVQDFGTISNVPTGLAHWELQGMYSGGRAAAKASALTLLFEVD